jgi:hypothetical protein
MGASDLFEDHKIVGGFRLALDLNNNDYLLAYENLKGDWTSESPSNGKPIQGVIDFGVVKVHTHNVRYQMSWPFSELASLRASVMYRNDRYVCNRASIRSACGSPNGSSDHMAGWQAGIRVRQFHAAWPEPVDRLEAEALR